MDLKDGDILVTPHLPDQGMVSIHIVEGDFPNCYCYDQNNSFHLNHQIRIKRSYGLKGNINIHNIELTEWYGKLSWFRLPVVPIEEYEGLFKDIIWQLEQNPLKIYGESEIDEFFEKEKNKILQLIRDSLNKMNPSRSKISFEQVCEQIITRFGYIVDKRNVCDGSGADID
jgi:hypothetical protein